jgi:AAA15 family ATPase/GTPase
MLIRFVTENFLSFNQEVEFSMVPGKSRKHPDHIDRNHIPVLRAAVIYGANASGKSNLIKAMDFARTLIVEGTKPRRLIPLSYFKLDKACADKPSKFEFEFKYRDQAYVYGFRLDAAQIHEEWLYEIKRTANKLLFERRTSEEGVTRVEFGTIQYARKKDEAFLEFVAEGTRPNQLFLTESIERDVRYFEDAYLWFAQVLVTIFPESKITPTGLNSDITQAMLEILQLFDIGISGIELKSVRIEDLDIAEKDKSDLLLEAGSNRGVVLAESNDQLYLFSRDEANEVNALKLVTKHKIRGGDEEAEFELIAESDGTRRLIDLIPPLLDLLLGERVVLIDELDRSLHPSLSYNLLRLFLSNKRRNLSQLVVTTHESSLLDLKLLRRDEIWFVEKDRDGASSVYSLEEFTPRYDKDVRKGYLLGRFGAIPVVGNESDRAWAV